MPLKKKIPIARPYLGEGEALAAADVIRSGWVTQGPVVERFENGFKDYVGSSYACAVSSCTTALHMALLVAGVGCGDIVPTVSHSFIATANAIRYCGAEPLFIDIDPETYNIDTDSLLDCLSLDCEVQNRELYYKHPKRLKIKGSPLNDFYGRIGRVSALLVVHQMGMPCDMSAVLRIASKFGLPVIEDAACAIGSAISLDNGESFEKIGRPHGDIACFSFHPRKVITVGDGGMLTTNNKSYDEKFRLLRQHGMSIPDSKRHTSKKVVFEKYLITGYNYRLSDICAAVGVEQLKKLPEIVEQRRNCAGLYQRHLGKVGWLRLPIEPIYARTNYQSYPLRLHRDAPITRDGLMQYMLDNGVSTRPGIMNAHSEPAYGGNKYYLPKSGLAREQTILLPMFYGLTEEDIVYISNLIANI